MIDTILAMWSEVCFFPFGYSRQKIRLRHVLHLKQSPQINTAPLIMEVA